MNSHMGRVASRAGIGDVYLNKNNPDSAIYHYTICLALLERSGKSVDMIEINTSLAKAYGLKNLYKTSAKYAKKAYDLSVEYQMKKEQVEAGRVLSNALSKMGDFKNAYKYISLSAAISDTLFNESKVKELTQMEMQYEFEIEKTKLEQQQDRERLIHEETLKRQKLVRNSIIAVCILLGIVLAIIYISFTRNKKAKKEKEALLKEIHHRVKNNLQIISSLLNIQTEYLSDSRIIETVHESQSRVKAMALIHQLLYQEENFTCIDFQVYLDQLIQTLADIFQKPETIINTKIVAEKIALDIDTSIPLGLIVTELVTNAYKYAFTDSTQGQILIELKKENRTYKLMISDNGKGLEDGFDIEKSNSMGLKLVKMLTKQLYGKLSIESNKGTTVKLEFTENN